MSSQAPFVRDDPDSLEADAFGHRDYADALVAIVRGESPPPTIGIFGAWGVGKSTIIGGVQRRLRGTEAAFVYFDAWRYEGDSLRRQFLTEAARQLDADGRLRAYRLEDELRELEVDTQELRESFAWSRARFTRAVVLGLVFGLAALAAALLGAFPALLGGRFGTKALAALTVFAVTALASALSQSVVVRPTTLTRRRLQDPDRFAAKFTRLLRSLRTERLVIAIDNLDRCSPEKAVEMLGTIKTYLEPAAAGEALPRSSATETVEKQIVFVIAVDDEALRRHLIAQEQASSVGRDEFAVRRYVDEYLAKFFNARITIRPILIDDMRGYVDAHIRPLAEARSLGEDKTRTLIALVARALRRNPRGVKQFSNDLESRLRLIAEREREKDGHRSIDPPISGEVVMIAKLALIETEWPDAFDQLQADPRLLERWTTQAIGESEVDWQPGEGLQRMEGRDDSETAERSKANSAARRSFGDFLRLSATTESRHLRAMLSLKQSQVELDLPGYPEFREAIVNGDRSAVEQLLGESEEAGRARLADSVADLLRAEIASRYLDFARVIVDVVLSVEAFAALGSSRGEVLRIAVEDPTLRGQLVSLDPALVLGQAGLLALPIRRRLLEVFLARLLRTETVEDVRRPFADAIGPWAKDLGTEQRQRVREAMDAGLTSQFDVILPLARVDPALLTLRVNDAALEALGRPRAGGPPSAEPRPLAENPAAVEVLELGLGDPNLDQELRTVALVAAIFGIYADQEAILAAELPLFDRLLGALELSRHEAWTELARAIEAHWSDLSRELWPEVISLARFVLARTEETVGEEVARAIAASAFEDPAPASTSSRSSRCPRRPCRAPSSPT